MIWFADNEGTIGPDAARDLLADFREHYSAYCSAYFAEPAGGQNVDTYREFTYACELAADGGLISFH